MKCAYCGAEIGGDVCGSSFVYCGPDKNGISEVKYEWWNNEIWCIKCQEKLFRLFCECVSVFPERYDREPDDSKLKAVLNFKDYDEDDDWW